METRKAICFDLEEMVALRFYDKRLNDHELDSVERFCDFYAAVADAAEENGEEDGYAVDIGDDQHIDVLVPVAGVEALIAYVGENGYALVDRQPPFVTSYHDGNSTAWVLGDYGKDGFVLICHEEI